MSSITASLLTSGGSASVAASFNTASISPSANKLLLLAVSSGTVSGPNEPTCSGAGMTWTKVATFLDASNGYRRITIFRSVNATPSTGAVTISFGGQNQDVCLWSITEFTGAAITGTNASDAIVQTATGETNTTGTGLTVTLGAFSNTENATFGYIRNNVNASAYTQGTGFSELAEVQVTNSGAETEFKETNDTSVDWSWSSTGGNFTAIAVEIAALVTVSTNYLKQRGRNRLSFSGVSLG